ncbi:hypothetical protein ABTX60_26685 [Streptomyces sp. NPDC126510]|uniref:hypothetical protein n=1 Tax=Streptomyces sp. NPDC126510 TaxID=3155317 RepID=UPI00331B240B
MDLSDETGRERARALVAESDVLGENLSTAPSAASVPAVAPRSPATTYRWARHRRRPLPGSRP